MITSVKEFLPLCLNQSRAYHSESYLSASMQRQYQLFRSIEARMLRDGSINPSLVSVGAGGAFVEQALVRKYKFAITVLDFPEMIERNRELYDACGFCCAGVDLAGGWPELPPASFVLSADNIEHVKTSAVECLANCRRLCQDGGEQVITTDNQRGLKTIERWMMGKRITPDLARVLSEV